MNPSRSPFLTLHTLSSLDAGQIETLGSLGITNISDLLSYPPFRYSRYLLAARDELLRREDVIGYVDASQQSKAITELLASPTDVLRDVGRQQAALLKKLGPASVAELAAFPAFEEAERLVAHAPSDDNDPFAPPCVLPTCSKFTRNSKSYTSFFKEKEIRTLSVLCNGNSGIASLFHFGSAQSKVVHLGYSVSYLQEWIYLGVHLGEPQGSVNLSMGQDTQVSMLDWRRAMRSLRAEDTRVSERLASVLFHQRAVDEVARATAEEHQHGATSAFGANAATAGSFVAAGAIVGGVGGGISGGLVGLSVDALLGGSTVGLGTLSGTVIGTAVGGAAGAAAGSIIASGATTLGFVQTDAEGDREIFAASGQDIQQRTIQNSSSIRSFWSSVVSQSVEQEQQTIRTDRLTNHNRIHALNAILFEILNGYRANISAQGFAPLLFLPFKPFTFTSLLLREYWWLLRTLLVDRNLVALLDEKYLKLTLAPNAIDQLEALPDIAEIRTAKVTVKINLDSSAIAEMFTNVVLGAILGAFRMVFDNVKRGKVKAKLVTTEGEIDLEADSYDEQDFVWTFSTSRDMEVASIQGVRIVNDNGEFEVLGIDLSSLKFDEVKASIRIRNKADFSGALPGLGQLETMVTVASEFEVGANSSTVVPWTIGELLRARFEGIDALRADLEAKASGIEDADQAEAMLLDFLNANKYTFTRLILQGTEPEQVMAALEDVRLGDIDLGEVAGTTPLGYCANHVVLPMKACTTLEAKYGGIGVDTSKLELILMQFDNVDRKKPAELEAYLRTLQDFLERFHENAADSGSGSVREAKLLSRTGDLLQTVDQVLQLASGGLPRGGAVKPGSIDIGIFDSRIAKQIRSVLLLLNAPISGTVDDTRLLCGHYASVKASLAARMGELLRSDEISLPSPAVFMEPVLSNAKGAELYDMRRNSHYALLESPSIAAASPDVLRSQPADLVPTVPESTLPVLAPPELPLPGALAAALGEAGRLDLGMLMQSNAASLAGMLSNLSTMATELAKASATLTGDAQKQALASAADVAKQVGDIAGKALQAPSETSQKPPPPTPSPRTQQEKAEVSREAQRIDHDDGTAKQKKALKRTIGAATIPDDARDYQFSIVFLDQDENPYVTGAFQFTLTLTVFELGSVVDVNGGAPIDLAREGFFFPETLALTRGRKVQLSVVADIGGVIVPGHVVLVLPDSRDVVFQCTMKSQTQEIQATGAAEAMRSAIRKGEFGASAGVLLERFLNLGAKFPFKVAEVSADGGTKGAADLKVELGSETTDTASGSASVSVVTTYKVTTPLNGWSISVQ